MHEKQLVREKQFGFVPPTASHADTAGDQPTAADEPL